MAKLVFGFFLLLTASIVGAVYVFLEYEYKPFLQAPMKKNAGEIIYNFSSGSTINSLIRDLDKKGLIEKPDYLRLYVKFGVESKKLKAGIYAIKPASQSPMDLLEMLTRGKVQHTKIRLRAGWPLKKVLANLASKQQLSHPNGSLQIADIKYLLGIKETELEGLLYPDTYLIEPGMKDLDLIKLAYDSMAEKLQTQWVERSDKIQVKTAYQALILASIIEKETANKEEKFLISGVFNNRLKKKMRLQTDPTIIYGMGDNFKGDLTKKNLRTDGPYNTYTRAGLPPTPICLPSLSSIHAALHPAETKAIFFVSKGNGTHYFSNTYKEHKKAVRKYQIEPYKKRKAKEKAEALAKKLAKSKDKSELKNNKKIIIKSKSKDKTVDLKKFVVELE